MIQRIFFEKYSYQALSNPKIGFVKPIVILDPDQQGFGRFGVFQIRNRIGCRLHACRRDAFLKIGGFRGEILADAYAARGIGKNIVVTLLRGSGYEVTDLGVDLYKQLYA